MAFSPNAETVYADGPFGSPLQPAKSEIRALLAQYEAAIDAYSSGAGSIAKSTRALLFADLAHAADATAWVYADPTVAYNGIYRKSGASGSGSWSLILPLPYSFIIATDAGAGTANAIQATTSIPVSGSALVWMNIFETNTASPVTVSFNGGTALTIKNNSGTNVAVGGLVGGMIVLGVVQGSEFRLVSDQASAAIIAQAQSILDEFQTIYLGAFAVAPTTDLEGNSLITGAQYFNTVSETLFTWNGTAWITNADLTIDVPSNLTSSVQAPAITKGNQYRWSIFAFNGGETERAKATNVADYRQVFETALSTGEKVDASRWEFPIRSYTASDRAISVTGDFPIDIEFASGSKVIVGNELAGLTAGVFSLRAATIPGELTEPKVPFRWIGGQFLNELEPTPGVTYGLTYLDIFYYTGPEVVGGLWYTEPGTPDGANQGLGYMDTAVTTHSCLSAQIRGRFYNFYDVGCYISGKSAVGSAETIIGRGEFDTIDGSYFFNCGNAITSKRNHVGLRVVNTDIVNCGNGIFSGIVDTGQPMNHGKRIMVGSCRIIRTQGRPIIVNGGTRAMIHNTEITDWGKWLSDGQTFTQVASNNRCAAIDFRGVAFGSVRGNQISQQQFAGNDGSNSPPESGKEPTGIQLLTGNDGTTGSSFNTIENNSLDQVHFGFIDASPAGASNKWRNNDYIAPSSGTAIYKSVSTPGSIFEGYLLEGSVTSDLASLADGAGTDVTITVTGAAIGDWVDSVSFSRDIAGLTYSANVTTANTVEIRLQNETGAAVDLANTIFKVRVRRA